jgi:short-subunit dehydrogenase
MLQVVESKGAALITGASSGIGAVYADRLARRGYDLILVARRAGMLQELASRLTAETGRTVETVVADLRDKHDLARVASVLRDDASITALVNNAGIAAITPMADTDIDLIDDMIDLNVTALTKLTHAAVPGLIARGGGLIINIASVAAVAPERLNGVYGASKAYVLALTQSLQHELADKGIRVQAVLPGATATDLWSNAGHPVENLPAEIVMTAENMVDAALAGLDQGEVYTLPALPDLATWNAYEAARKALGPGLSLTRPAARYGLGT